jgi:hypothetical protein
VSLRVFLLFAMMVVVVFCSLVGLRSNNTFSFYNHWHFPAITKAADSENNRYATTVSRLPLLESQNVRTVKEDLVVVTWLSLFSSYSKLFLFCSISKELSFLFGVVCCLLGWYCVDVGVYHSSKAKMYVQ